MSESDTTEQQVLERIATALEEIARKLPNQSFIGTPVTHPASPKPYDPNYPETWRWTTTC